MEDPIENCKKLTFFTANSFPAWNTTNTIAFPPYPILLAVALLLGSGY